MDEQEQVVINLIVNSGSARSSAIEAIQYAKAGDIKKAEERLEYLSSDPQTMEIYWERERALYEKANLISTGEHKEKVNTILRSYKLGFTTKQIAQIVELEENKVIEIISKNNLVQRN